MDIEKVTF